MYPADLKYTNDHEWIRVTGDQGQMGITDYAQKQLGDIVYVELPAVGRTVSRGEAIGTIESVKAVSEVFAPVSGWGEAAGDFAQVFANVPGYDGTQTPGRDQLLSLFLSWAFPGDGFVAHIISIPNPTGFEFFPDDCSFLGGRF